MTASFGIGSLKELDNLDDRRELFYLLSLLNEAERKAFVEHAIYAINQGIIFAHDPPHVLLTVHQEYGTIQEAFMDLNLAIAKYSLPIKALLTDLEHYVSQLGKIVCQSDREKCHVPAEILLD